MSLFSRECSFNRNNQEIYESRVPLSRIITSGSVCSGSICCVRRDRTDLTMHRGGSFRDAKVERAVCYGERDRTDLTTEVVVLEMQR